MSNFTAELDQRLRHPRIAEYFVWDQACVTEYQAVLGRRMPEYLTDAEREQMLRCKRSFAEWEVENQGIPPEHRVDAIDLIMREFPDPPRECWSLF